MLRRFAYAACTAVGFVGGCVWMLTCAPGHAQSAEVTSAIEAGIAAGLPRGWAYRVAWCESRYAPWARNRRSGAMGLYQFMPSTWRTTPQGRAGYDPYDPYANALAAAWLYRTYGPRQWVCT